LNPERFVGPFDFPFGRLVVALGRLTTAPAEILTLSLTKEKNLSPPWSRTRCRPLLNAVEICCVQVIDIEKTVDCPRFCYICHLPLPKS
jgi:hypothetical protein